MKFIRAADSDTMTELVPARVVYKTEVLGLAVVGIDDRAIKRAADRMGLTVTRGVCGIVHLHCGICGDITDLSPKRKYGYYCDGEKHKIYYDQMERKGRLTDDEGREGGIC